MGEEYIYYCLRLLSHTLLGKSLNLGKQLHLLVSKFEMRLRNIYLGNNMSWLYCLLILQ